MIGREDIAGLGDGQLDTDSGESYGASGKCDVGNKSGSLGEVRD